MKKNNVITYQHFNEKKHEPLSYEESSPHKRNVNLWVNLT